MITRRGVLKVGAAAAIASAAACRQAAVPGPRGTAVVTILGAGSYQADLLDLMRRGAAACHLQARGKRVLLKAQFG